MKITLSREHRTVARACATDACREELTNVVVGNGRIAGADGFVLAAMSHPYKGKPVLIPAKFLKLFEKQWDVTFSVGSKYISAEAGGVTHTTPRCTKSFPNYAGIFGELESVSPKAMVALSIPVIKHMLKSIPENSVPGGVLRFYVREKMHAVCVRAKCVEAVSHEPLEEQLVVMPMFTSWEDGETGARDILPRGQYYTRPSG